MVLLCSIIYRTNEVRSFRHTVQFNIYAPQDHGQRRQDQLCTGRIGRAVGLLHGYPQTWYSFRYIMPELAKYFTVIVPDMRGRGDSGRPGSGYDTATVAEDIYQLVCGLGYERIYL